MFSKHRSFTTLTVLTLALGIGACTAIFSLVNAALLRSLPYGNPERLVYLFTPTPQYHLPPDIIGPSKADFFDLKKQSRSYAAMTLFEQAMYNLSVGEQTQRIGVAKADADFFRTLDVRPLFGRIVDAADLQPGKDRIAVISYSLWQSIFDGASDVLGRSPRATSFLRSEATVGKNHQMCASAQIAIKAAISMGQMKTHGLERTPAGHP